MASRCTICNHPERTRIEMLRIAGTSLDALVKRFELGDGGRDRLWRHMKAHVSDADRAALVADIPLSELAARAAAENMSLLDYLKVVRGGLMQLFLAAVAAGDLNGSPRVAGRLLESLRDIAELTGELMRGAPVTNITTNNVVYNSTVLFTLQSILIEELSGDTAALARVLERLAVLEAPPLAIEAQRHAA